MVARQGHREFVPLVVGKSVSECRNVVVLVVAVVNAKLILLTFALDLKKSCRYMADVRLCCPVIFVYPVRLLRFEIRSRTSLLEYTQPHAVRTMYRVAMYRIKYPLPNGPMPVPIGKFGRNPLQKTCLRSLYPKCEASV